jgi:long-chain fatty acid transport protein
LKTLSVAVGPTFNYSSIDLRRGIAAIGDEFKFTGDDYGIGFNAGLLWKPFEKHAFGLSYRSETTMEFDGQSRVLPASYGIPQQDASARVPFPQVIVAGYSFRPTPHWNLEVDFDWTDWERVNTPVLKQASGNMALPLRWDSSWAIQAGVTRYFDNGLHASAGYVYLENSVPEKSYTPMVPDQDAHVFSVGLGGKYKRVTWDATYQFTWGPGRDVAGSVYGPAVTGDYSSSVHRFSISIGWHF